MKIEYRTYADKIGWGLARIERNEVVATEQFSDRETADARLERYVQEARKQNGVIDISVISDTVGTSAVIRGT